MTIFVYYNDDYPENDGTGFKEFPSRDEAAKFVEDRLKRAEKPDIDNYKIIEGKELKLTVFEVATRIKINNY